MDEKMQILSINILIVQLHSTQIIKLYLYN